MQIAVGDGDALVPAEIAGDGGIARFVAVHVGQERMAKAMNSREQLDGALLGRKGFPYTVGRHALALLREKQRFIGCLGLSSQQIARHVREDKGGHIDLLPIASLAANADDACLDFTQMRDVQAAKLEGAQPAAQKQGDDGRIAQRVALRSLTGQEGEQRFDILRGVDGRILILRLFLFLDAMKGAAGILGDDLHSRHESEVFLEHDHIEIARGGFEAPAVQILINQFRKEEEF